MTGIIPARWASTRFPGKPLHLLAGKPLIQHVWERCREAKRLTRIVVATDDDRIAVVAKNFGAEVFPTRTDHPSGTDRIAEVARQLPENEPVINIQGDEPLVDPALIDCIAEALTSEDPPEMVTAASVITDPSALVNPNIVKAVLNRAGDALYFSRSRIPFPRNTAANAPAYHHIGIYGYQRAFLLQFVEWPQGVLEQAEQLEQLRALENGARIRVLITAQAARGVDTPADVAFVEAHLAGR
ncbi:MAG TPA: 3-deoxy-manno-octulosonate cytidylyltransferase [Chthoniobacterales bacterium]